ncbi:hypothetical protein BUALT_Bualt17G0092500 [Buddleja alternifolia]|uniref:Uncharacterized protein n=1 Tax=Buddleja alternifolia TaxID=168488 RepID=A0AAV6WCQ8_9LAMI|nr:hypothetical protein BUALT_Bualt17G0092500 [Buddleja alternifolia]
MITMKIPRIFFPFIFLFLILLLFHDSYSTNSYNSYEHHPLISHRKALSSKFDFTPFLKHRRELPPAFHTGPPGSGSEIDHRYGAEKRLVPSGPNPLHH